MDKNLYLEKYSQDPMAFFTEILGIQELFPWQIAVCEHVKRCFESPNENMKCLIAIAGGNNTGKSYFGKLLMIWHFATQHESRNVMLTNSERQTKSTGYYAIQRIIEQVFSPKILKNLESRVSFAEKGDDTSGIWDISFLLRSNHESGLTGMHFPRMHFFLDECIAFPDHVWRAIETMTLSGRVLVYAAGNPIATGNPFHDIFIDPDNIMGWYRSNVSLLEIPEKYYDKAFVESRAKKYGTNDAKYRSSVLGEFTDEEGADSRFSRELVAKAMATKPVESAVGPLVLAVDVASGAQGRDRSAVCLRRGPTVILLESLVGRYEDAQDQVIELIRLYKPEHVVIDANGIGYGMASNIEALARSNREFYVSPIKGQEKAADYQTFADNRSEMAWKLSSWLQDEYASLPYIQGLDILMSKLQFKPDAKGRLQLNAKSDLKISSNKLLPKVDIVDALIYSFYYNYNPHHLKVFKYA